MVMPERVLKIILTHVLDGLEVRYERMRGAQEDSRVSAWTPGRKMLLWTEMKNSLGLYVEFTVAHIASGLSTRHVSGYVQERVGHLGLQFRKKAWP